MSRLKILQRVAEKTKNDEDKAMAALAAARQLHHEEALKLADIQAYFEDYKTSFSAQTSGVRVATLMQQRVFLSQLQQAIVQQTQTLAQRASLVDLKYTTWTTAHIRTSAVETLITQLKADEQKILSKKEEKLLDEWTTAAFVRQTPSASI